jgi:hypothetical protein
MRKDGEIWNQGITEGVVQLRGSWNSLLSWLREAQAWGRMIEAAI